MKSIFVELPPFERRRQQYLTDEQFHMLQSLMMNEPEVGDIIPGAGGIRKLRFRDSRRGKGKRGGLRIIYYWWQHGREFWLFTLYDKDETVDLSPEERKILQRKVKAEVAARKNKS